MGRVATAVDQDLESGHELAEPLDEDALPVGLSCADDLAAVTHEHVHARGGAARGLVEDEDQTLSGRFLEHQGQVREQDQGAGLQVFTPHGEDEGAAPGGQTLQSVEGDRAFNVLEPGVALHLHGPLHGRLDDGHLHRLDAVDAVFALEVFHQVQGVGLEGELLDVAGGHLEAGGLLQGEDTFGLHLEGPGKETGDEGPGLAGLPGSGEALEQVLQGLHGAGEVLLLEPQDLGPLELARGRRVTVQAGVPRCHDAVGLQGRLQALGLFVELGHVHLRLRAQLVRRVLGQEGLEGGQRPLGFSGPSQVGGACVERLHDAALGRGPGGMVGILADEGAPGRPRGLVRLPVVVGLGDVELGIGSTLAPGVAVPEQGQGRDGFLQLAGAVQGLAHAKSQGLGEGVVGIGLDGAREDGDALQDGALAALLEVGFRRELEGLGTERMLQEQAVGLEEVLDFGPGLFGLARVLVCPGLEEPDLGGGREVGKSLEEVREGFDGLSGIPVIKVGPGDLHGEFRLFPLLPEQVTGPGEVADRLLQVAHLLPLLEGIRGGRALEGRVRHLQVMVRQHHLVGPAFHGLETPPEDVGGEVVAALGGVRVGQEQPGLLGPGRGGHVLQEPFEGGDGGRELAAVEVGLPEEEEGLVGLGGAGMAPGQVREHPGRAVVVPVGHQLPAALEQVMGVVRPEGGPGDEKEENGKEEQSQSTCHVLSPWIGPGGEWTRIEGLSCFRAFHAGDQRTLSKPGSEIHSTGKSRYGATRSAFDPEAARRFREFRRQAIRGLYDETARKTDSIVRCFCGIVSCLFEACY